MTNALLLGIKNLLFTLLVPGFVAVYVPLRMLGIVPEAREHAGLLWPLSILAFGLGGAIYFWCLYDFAVTGRGTPAPIDPPRVLVVRGLYRYTRNPMYVGVLCVVAGWWILLGNAALLWYLLSLAMMFHLFVLFVEEPILRSKFGESYLDYCRQVHRWVPRRPGTSEVDPPQHASPS